jgi:hypothetical protein
MGPIARSLLAIATLVASIGSSLAQEPAGARAPLTGTERLVGTIKAIDPRAGTVDLVTGVGLSLRLRHIHLPAALRAKGAPSESSAVALAPGAIVRLECHRTTEGTVASTVELVRPAPRGMKR